PQGRLIRGGAWSDNTYAFTYLSQAAPLDRSPTNGFRCALYPDAVPDAVLGTVQPSVVPDYDRVDPVSDDIFQVYKEQFAYDETPLNARVESSDARSDFWVHERVTFDAAYGGERMIAHLFLPKNASPPYQTVIYFPGSASLFQPSSEDLVSYYEFPVFLSFLVKSGRAVLYPVYKGTFERRDDAVIPLHIGNDSYSYTEYVVQLVKDLGRSIDYLESREDIASDRLAYYGMSWGGFLGALIPAVEDRLQASVLVAGSLHDRGRPEVNLVNYVTRVETPTLMLNGRYDQLNPNAIEPLYELLGTPDEHKALKLYETDHIPPRTEYIKETLAWLDRYLGPVD
ncbi:MAG: hypothetical protein R3362_02230, partial [Rhodothermales bacterium]|nr:hypothetical protein [Rhodothermales bacterium]